ncbi:TPA: hypothetical protein ACOQZT_004726, partial [Serratia odorifera]
QGFERRRRSARTGTDEQQGKYKSMFQGRSSVGASLLAKVANDNAPMLKKCGVFAFFASKLAPTGGGRK